MGQLKSFTTKLPYIARSPLYKEEKPFSCDFDHSDSSYATNHQFDWTSVVIEDIADLANHNLDTNGFCVLKLKSILSPADALNKKQEIESLYTSEVEALLHHHFPEYSRIEMMNIVVRKRDPRYPSPGHPAIVGHEQPAGVPHSDFSLGGLPLQIELSFPGQWDSLKEKDFDVLNVWRPLHGPNNDWPLAICDFASIESEDLILNDDLHRDRAAENTLLHPNDGHRWYYISDQTTEDALVFRTIDSTGKRARGFHCAVDSPHAPPGQLRSSIEMRLVAVR